MLIRATTHNPHILHMGHYLGTVAGLAIEAWNGSFDHLYHVAPLYVCACTYFYPSGISTIINLPNIFWFNCEAIPWNHGFIVVQNMFKNSNNKNKHLNIELGLWHLKKPQQGGKRWLSLGLEHAPWTKGKPCKYWLNRMIFSWWLKLNEWYITIISSRSSTDAERGLKHNKVHKSFFWIYWIFFRFTVYMHYSTGSW